MNSTPEFEKAKQFVELLEDVVDPVVYGGLKAWLDQLGTLSSDALSAEMQSLADLVLQDSEGVQPAEIPARLYSESKRMDDAIRKIMTQLDESPQI